MNNIFKSILDVFKDRTDNPFFQEKSNPFGGTYLIIWCIYNWKLIFSIFNFDSSFTLQCKLIYIQGVISSTTIYGVFLMPLLFTLISLFIFYIFSSISLFISDSYFSILRPIIIKYISGKSSIVTRDTHEKLQKNYLDLYTKKEETENKLSGKDAEIKIINDKANKNIIAINNYLKDIEERNETLFNFNKYKVIAISDEETIWQKGNYLVSSITPMHADWNDWLYKFRNKLTGAFWITSEYPIHDNEAIQGGIYQFEKKFSLDIESQFISSITMNCIVDDFIKIRINNKSNDIIRDVNGITEPQGYNNLITYDLTEHCKFGINTLYLEVRNIESASLNWNQDVKSPYGYHNPYGVAFAIIVEYKNPFTILQKPVELI